MVHFREAEIFGYMVHLRDVGDSYCLVHWHAVGDSPEVVRKFMMGGCLNWRALRNGFLSNMAHFEQLGGSLASVHFGRLGSSAKTVHCLWLGVFNRGSLISIGRLCWCGSLTDHGGLFVHWFTSGGLVVSRLMVHSHTMEISETVVHFHRMVGSKTLVHLPALDA